MPTNTSCYDVNICATCASLRSAAVPNKGQPYKGQPSIPWTGFDPVTTGSHDGSLCNTCVLTVHSKLAGHVTIMHKAQHCRKLTSGELIATVHSRQHEMSMLVTQQESHQDRILLPIQFNHKTLRSNPVPPMLSYLQQHCSCATATVLQVPTIYCPCATTVILPWMQDCHVCDTDMKALVIAYL